MVELFARSPDGFPLAEGSQLTPIPLDEALSSLSAILMDDDYYEFIMAGRRELDGLPWIGEKRLIPLKAIAWLPAGLCGECLCLRGWAGVEQRQTRADARASVRFSLPVHRRIL